MMFDLQEDRGSRIAIYVVPDSGGTIPSVRVCSDGDDLLVLSANETIQGLVQAGRHSTGICGFVIDDSHIPKLASYDDLEIVEVETGILIYRRALPDMMSSTNLFRLETHLLPLWRVDDALKGRFQYWYRGIDRFGRETSTQVFCLKNMNSSYISGRLLYKNYEYYLTERVKTIAMFRNPYDELAERLILLKNIGKRSEEILGARDTITFGPVMEMLAEYDELDEKFCKRFFKRAPEPVYLALANPAVRQLTVSTPDEMPNRAAVATALEILSRFDLIGLRSESADFGHALADMLAIPEASLPSLAEYPRVSELGERLRGNPAAEAFLEKDLELFHLLDAAFRTAGR